MLEFQVLVGIIEVIIWDRSFDLHYLLNKEKNFFPSIAIG